MDQTDPLAGSAVLTSECRRIRGIETVSPFIRPCSSPALVDVRGLRERPARLRCGNGGVPAATCSVWSEVRESPHSWVLLPEVSAPILGRIYASDAGSVASEGFQNLSPVRGFRISRVAWFGTPCELRDLSRR